VIATVICHREVPTNGSIGYQHGFGAAIEHNQAHAQIQRSARKLSMLFTSTSQLKA
jgi:hypothetical protein